MEGPTPPSAGSLASARRSQRANSESAFGRSAPAPSKARPRAASSTPKAGTPATRAKAAERAKEKQSLRSSRAAPAAAPAEQSRVTQLPAATPCGAATSGSIKAARAETPDAQAAETIEQAAERSLAATILKAQKSLRERAAARANSGAARSPSEAAAAAKGRSTSLTQRGKPSSAAVSPRESATAPTCVAPAAHSPPPSQPGSKSRASASAPPSVPTLPPATSLLSEAQRKDLVRHMIRAAAGQVDDEDEAETSAAEPQPSAYAHINSKRSAPGPTVSHPRQSMGAAPLPGAPSLGFLPFLTSSSTLIEEADTQSLSATRKTTKKRSVKQSSTTADAPAAAAPAEKPRRRTGVRFAAEDHSVSLPQDDSAASALVRRATGSDDEGDAFSARLGGTVASPSALIAAGSLDAGSRTNSGMQQTQMMQTGRFAQTLQQRKALDDMSRTITHGLEDPEVDEMWDLNEAYAEASERRRATRESRSGADCCALTMPPSEDLQAIADSERLPSASMLLMMNSAERADDATAAGGLGSSPHEATSSLLTDTFKDTLAHSDALGKMARTGICGEWDVECDFDFPSSSELLTEQGSGVEAEVTEVKTRAGLGTAMSFKVTLRHAKSELPVLREVNSSDDPADDDPTLPTAPPHAWATQQLLQSGERGVKVDPSLWSASMAPLQGWPFQAAAIRAQVRKRGAWPKLKAVQEYMRRSLHGKSGRSTHSKLRTGPLGSDSKEAEASTSAAAESIEKEEGRARRRRFLMRFIPCFRPSQA